MITRDEIIDVCNRLGLIEIHSPLLPDFRLWIFKNSIFSRQHNAAIVVLSQNPYEVISGNRLYFYDKLRLSPEDGGYNMESADQFNAYCTKKGIDYTELFNKKTFEKAICNVIKKIKKKEMDLKLARLMNDF